MPADLHTPLASVHNLNDGCDTCNLNSAPSRKKIMLLSCRFPEQYEEDDVSGIIDLVEVIRIQASGPTEAARALRKKLKYGNPHRQLRALVILDGLIQNAGSRFQRTFADEPLLERLRLLPRDDVVDPQVRQKCKVLFVQWANGYKNTPGLERIANLYKELPKSQRPVSARQKVLKDSESANINAEPPQDPPSTSLQASRSRAMSSTPKPGALSTPSRPVTLTSTSSNFSSKLSKSKKANKSFNLAKEKDNMTTYIARASIASTNLLNGLQLINRETERVSENPEVRNRYEICKTLRRQILSYIQQVESDEWIGSLVNANDELVKALTAYEIMDRSISDDSDSDAWENDGSAPVSGHSRSISQTTQQQLAGLSIDAAPVKSPRSFPANITMPANPSFPSASRDETVDDHDVEDDEDEDNPFGDANAVPTPRQERAGMTWRERKTGIVRSEVDAEPSFGRRTAVQMNSDVSVSIRRANHEAGSWGTDGRAVRNWEADVDSETSARIEWSQQTQTIRCAGLGRSMGESFETGYQEPWHERRYSTGSEKGKEETRCTANQYQMTKRNEIRPLVRSLTKGVLSVVSETQRRTASRW
nr:protein lsb5 [Quercus suber]